jgi:hypothetical protein
MHHIHSSTALHALAELLGTVILVQEVVGDFLEISQMTVEKGRSDGEEIRVTRIVHLDNTPWVLASADLPAPNLNNVFRADDGEGHQASKLGVLLNRVLIIFLNIVGEVVDGDSVVFNILHHKLLGLGKLGWRQGVGPTNDGNHVDTGGKALHQLNVELAQAVEAVSVDSDGTRRRHPYPWPVGVIK